MRRVRYLFTKRQLEPALARRGKEAVRFVVTYNTRPPWGARRPGYDDFENGDMVKAYGGSK